LLEDLPKAALQSRINLRPAAKEKTPSKNEVRDKGEIADFDLGRKSVKRF